MSRVMGIVEVQLDKQEIGMLESNHGTALNAVFDSCLNIKNVLFILGIDFVV